MGLTQDGRPQAAAVHEGGTTVAPILPSRDFGRTAGFYERLGFTVASTYQPPDAYLIMRKGNVELHFFAHVDLDPTTSYAGCYLRVPNVEAWFATAKDVGLAQTGIPRLMALNERAWGMREFALIDPDGSLLRIGTRSA